MKTKVEINGYEIVIEEKDGLISVSATKDEEVVEEFEIETEEGQFNDEEGEDVQGFDEFGQDEEEDFEGDEDSEFESDEDSEEDSEEDSDEEEDFEGEEDENEVKLESFQSFINKRK